MGMLCHELAVISLSPHHRDRWDAFVNDLQVPRDTWYFLRCIFLGLELKGIQTMGCIDHKGMLVTKLANRENGGARKLFSFSPSVN